MVEGETFSSAGCLCPFVSLFLYVSLCLSASVSVSVNLLPSFSVCAFP